jgi:hypothetical protein
VNSRILRSGLAVLLLAGSAMIAGAQTVDTDTVNVRDVDNEARNAYQQPYQITTLDKTSVL